MTASGRTRMLNAKSELKTNYADRQGDSAFD